MVCRTERSWHTQSSTRIPRPLILLAAAVFLAGLTVLDYYLGFFLRLSLLYLLPIVVVTWTCGFLPGLAFCILACIGNAVNELPGILLGASLAADVINDLLASSVFFLALYVTRWRHRIMENRQEGFEQLRRLKNSLQESEGRLRQAQALARLGSWEWEEDGEAMQWSAEFEHLLGYAPGAVEPSRAALLERMDEPERKNFEALLEEARTTGGLARGDVTVRTGDGKEAILACHVKYMASYVGGKFLGVAQDVTERRRLEQLREQVERIVQHDLKSPLVGIIGIPDLLARESNLTPQQVEMLRAISEAGRTMLRMINLSLAVYRMERGEFVLEPRPFDLLGLLRRVLADLASLAKACGVTTRLACESKEPGKTDGIAQELPASGDETLCYSMLANLVRNAVEAGPKGTEVSVDVHCEGDGAVIAIHNPAVVPPDVRDRFFTKYVTSGKKEGTGLGTYSARLAARAHGGDITMQTSEETGTTVTVRLPLCRIPGAPGA
ncbi:multi-sensor signal transduction histidine kinase [Desulfovibrio sp. X2]|uniref:sensor histidine kinase n=1 Tax=Desulfovibrio sp. X2 TaxID=941449 RepID=UPI000358CF2F|nr:PAS domain-containing sensor histidine kinase [Desulfovibrio sp. X2]EPR43936.1 multi-sensor signal transduction histidine kinase [Desulfovibrio sp. X2]